MNSLKNNQKVDYVFEIIEEVFMFCYAFTFFVFEFIECFRNKSDKKEISPKVYFWLYISGMIAMCGLIVPHIIAYIKMKKNVYLDDYNCSDSLTNEVIRTGKEIIKKY